MKIKTIKSTFAEDFDEAVNSHLDQGWVIRGLETGGINNVAVLVAFLVKGDDDEV